MLHKNSEGQLEQGAVHGWFGLTYSSYFVIPRVALDAMPLDWQQRFVDLMNEADEMGLKIPDDYTVQRRDKRGRFINDPWSNYRHPDKDVIQFLKISLPRSSDTKDLTHLIGDM